MRLVSINIGQERELENGARREKTGIFKIPTYAPIVVTQLGIAEDYICDSHHHGGPDQAIYVYGSADYDWWSAELGKELPPGIFGENLTISGLESADFSIGDRLKIGDVILEVSAPRIPCGTLARRMGDPQFVKRYRQAERPGLYCRVIQPGSLQVEMLVTVGKCQVATISIIEMFRDYYDKGKSEEAIHRLLKAPIASRSRLELEHELRKRSENPAD
jgi:MOSC domain-containing protein YiiM